VPFATTNGRLTDDADLTWSTATDTLTPKNLTLGEVDWDDFTIPATQIANAPGTTPPGFNSTEGCLEWIHTNTRDMLVNMEPGHRYKEGTTVYLHWHGNCADNTAGNIQLVISHRIRTRGTAVPAWTVDAPILIPSGSTTDEQIVDLKTKTAAGATIGSVFQFRVQRLINASDTYDNSFYMSSIGVHFEVNTLGSQTVSSK
jgi:hypothetical protein